jgi:SET domain-containing protein
MTHDCFSNWPTKNEEGKPEVKQAVVFGLGSMFNHSSEPNVVWQRDLDRLIVVYKANRDIQEGEELCKLILQ